MDGSSLYDTQSCQIYSQFIAGNLQHSKWLAQCVLSPNISLKKKLLEPLQKWKEEPVFSRVFILKVLTFIFSCHWQTSLMAERFRFQNQILSPLWSYCECCLCLSDHKPWARAVLGGGWWEWEWGKGSRAKVLMRINNLWNESLKFAQSERNESGSSFWSSLSIMVAKKRRGNQYILCRYYLTGTLLGAGSVCACVRGCVCVCERDKRG